MNQQNQEKQSNEKAPQKDWWGLSFGYPEWMKKWWALPIRIITFPIYMNVIRYKWQSGILNKANEKSINLSIFWKIIIVLIFIILVVAFLIRFYT